LVVNPKKLKSLSNPIEKDIFLEIDTMEDAVMPREGKVKVATTFAERGIRLHIADDCLGLSNGFVSPDGSSLTSNDNDKSNFYRDHFVKMCGSASNREGIFTYCVLTDGPVDTTNPATSIEIKERSFTISTKGMTPTQFKFILTGNIVLNTIMNKGSDGDWLDSDGDYLYDWAESWFETDPEDKDSDGDFLSDIFEIIQIIPYDNDFIRMNPNDPSDGLDFFIGLRDLSLSRWDKYDSLAYCVNRENSEDIENRFNDCKKKITAFIGNQLGDSNNNGIFESNEKMKLWGPEFVGDFFECLASLGAPIVGALGDAINIYGAINKVIEVYEFGKWASKWTLGTIDRLLDNQALHDADNWYIYTDPDIHTTLSQFLKARTESCANENTYLNTIIKALKSEESMTKGIENIQYLIDHYSSEVSIYKSRFHYNLYPPVSKGPSLGAEYYRELVGETKDMEDTDYFQHNNYCILKSIDEYAYSDYRFMRNIHYYNPFVIPI